MRENVDQNIFEYGHLLRSVCLKHMYIVLKGIRKKKICIGVKNLASL